MGGDPSVRTGCLAAWGGGWLQTLTLVPHLTNAIIQHHRNQSTFDCAPHAEVLTPSPLVLRFRLFHTITLRTLSLDWTWAPRGH